MELYWKTVAGVLLAVVLALTIGRQERDLSMVLVMVACAMTGAAALSFLKPVVGFLLRLEALMGISGDIAGLMLKILGISLVSEIGGQLCADAGNSSLGKGLQLLGSAVILQLSVPVFEGMLDMIRKLLGEL